MTLDDLAALPQSSFREPPPQAVWKQVNVALLRANGDALPSARALFRGVMPVLDDWCREGLLHGWFFMRKPPDVRLRVCLAGDAGDAVPAIDRMLQAAQARGEIGESSWSEYSPEEERFGGPAGMTTAHAYFNVDSTLWRLLDDLDERGLRRTPADALMPAVLHHMFECCCGSGRAEQAWRELVALVSEGMPVSIPESATEAAGLPPTLDVLAAAPGVQSSERAALQAYAAANELLCKHLTALQENLRIERSPCEIAAMVGFFNLNRHGFRGERSAPMAARVIAAITADRKR